MIKKEMNVAGFARETGDGGYLKKRYLGNKKTSMVSAKKTEYHPS